MSFLFGMYQDSNLLGAGVLGYWVLGSQKSVGTQTLGGRPAYGISYILLSTGRAYLV